MENANRSRDLKTGTWLVLGLLALGIGLILVSRVYRTPPTEDWRETLRQQGAPAARRGMTLSQEGRKLLPVEEQHELSALYDEALQSLEPEERERFWTLARKGRAAADQEIAESALLIQDALRSLPREKSTRLFALVEKAVRLQHAQRAKTDQQQ